MSKCVDKILVKLENIYNDIENLKYTNREQFLYRQEELSEILMNLEEIVNEEYA